MDMKKFIETFNGGEISEDLYGRTDLLKAVGGCKVFKNFLPNIQGTATFRGGFKFAGQTKNNARTLLLDFTFTENDALTIEVGNLYMRFYKNGEPVMSGGSVYEIVSPYAAADLFDANGCVLLNKCQSGDTVYFFHSKYPVQRLFRNADGTFTLTAVDFAEYGGFMDLNRDKSVRVYASAATGTITLTASSPIFDAGYVGCLFYLQNIHFEDIYSWSEGKSVTANQKIMSNDCLYTAVAAGTTGASKPTHTEGTGTDGAVSWVYHDAGYGICKITACAADKLSATATVLVTLPADVVGSTKSTWKWKFGAWSAQQGYPSVGCFFRERLVMGNGKRIWLSWIGDFEDFSEKDVAQITYETGFSSQISSGQTLGDIQWLMPIEDLMIGTTTNLCAFGEADNQNVMSVFNCKSEETSTNSNRPVVPVKVGQKILFSSFSGKEIYCLDYTPSTGQYQAESLCKFAKHINQAGVIKMVHQKEPNDLVWCLLGDGKLTVLLFDPVQEGLCWCECETDGEIESLSLEGKNVVVSVKRENSGGVFRSVEYLVNPFDEYFRTSVADYANEAAYEQARIEFYEQYQSDMIYSDSAVVLKSNDPVLNVASSKLSHLVGRTVSVVADGAYEEHEVEAVTGGYGFTLENAAKTVVVGLPYRGVIIPTRIADMTQIGNNAADIKKIQNISIRVWNSLGGRYSDGDGRWFNIIERTGGNRFGHPVPLYSGQTDFLSFDGDFKREPDMVIDQPYPFPLVIQSIVFDYE